MSKLKTITGLMIIFSLIGFSVTTVAELSPREKLIEKRIKPVGDVYTDGAAPSLAAAGGEMTPEARYKKVCSVCHAAGVAGAPVVGNKASWSSHIAKGTETLYKHAINGFNAMPAKGTCMQCSDDEIKKIVDWMVAESK